MKSNCLESVTGYWLKLGYNKMHNWCAAFSAVAELLWNDVQSASRDSLLSSSTRTSTWRIYSLLSSDAIWLSWRSDNSMQKMLFSGLFKLYSWQTFISCFIIHQHIATEDLLKWPFSPTPALMHMQPPNSDQYNILGPISHHFRDMATSRPKVANLLTLYIKHFTLNTFVQGEPIRLSGWILFGNKKAELPQRWPHNVPYIWVRGALKISESLSTPTATFPKKFNGRMDLLNVSAKFEVCNVALPAPEIIAIEVLGLLGGGCKPPIFGKRRP